jgi:aconitate hydratase
VTAILHHAHGTTETLELRHTLNNEQISWFRAGSALNLLRQQKGPKTGALSEVPPIA